MRRIEKPETYYKKVCSQCVGKEECNPRDDDNIRNCMMNNRSKYQKGEKDE